MKTLIISTAFTLALASFGSAAFGDTRTGNFPHLEGGVEFPRVNYGVTRHSFRLSIPDGSKAKAVSQMMIDVPDGLRAGEDIKVSDQSGREINANVSVNDKKVTIDFPEPVAPGSTLNISMKNVYTSGIPRISVYRVAAQLVDFNTELPIGVVEIRSGKH